MADSSYVALKNESSTSWYEMVLCEDTQSPQITPPVTDPVLTPGGHFQENGRGRGRGRGGSTRGRGRGGWKGKCKCQNSKESVHDNQNISAKNGRGKGRGRNGNGQANGTVRTTNVTGGTNNGPKQKIKCTLCGDFHYHNLLF